MLTATFLSAFIGAALILLLPEKLAKCAKWLALASALTGFGFALAAFHGYDLSKDPIQYVTNLAWVDSIGIRFLTCADGISLVLLVLTGIIAITGVLFSWNVTERPRAFFAFFLTIIGGVYGVFQSFDLFLLFVFY